MVSEGTVLLDRFRQQLLLEYLTRVHFFDLVQIVKATLNGPFRLFINVLDLLDFSPKLAHDTLKSPKEVMSSLKPALIQAQEAVIVQLQNETQSLHLEPKPKVQVSFCGLPLVSDEYIFQRCPPLAAQGRLILVRGTVVRVGSPRMIESSGKYECVRCKCEYEVEADMCQYAQVPKPAICTASIDGQECRTSKFNKVFGFKGECEDYQEVRLQESTSSLDIGSVPRSLTVVLRKDLIDKTSAGETVEIVGILQSRWRPLKSGAKAELELFIEANNVICSGRDRAADRLEVSVNFSAPTNDFWSRYKETPMEGRSQIVASFCPTIHGMFLPKLAVLLVLVGGCSADEEDNVDLNGSRKHRKEGHILLVGDPGTAKSQLLMGAAKLANRAIFTTGSGSTNAGLTVTAVKEGADWSLEAGALVLADKGICCIDEFSQLKSSDRTAIHEAMEQQTLSVAKAGLVCRLSTRCSIIAACNSKGKFEEAASISSNTAIASPLLSRFDLILVLLDRRSAEWDKELSKAILSAACNPTRPRGICKDGTWDMEMLKAYISFTKHQGQPRMSNAARVIISKYYQAQRNCANRDAARTTVRLLESLIRLSQAHAKLLWQTEILPHDAITAILLMESSLQTQSLLGVKPDLYEGPPEDPTEQYSTLAAQIIAKLQINPAVFEGEAEVMPDEAAEIDEILCSWAPTQR